MKDETKSKLKKYGKRAGFGLGLVAFFLLGVGVGACSARKAVGSSAEGISQPAPRMALNPSDNLLDKAILYSDMDLLYYGSDELYLSGGNGWRLYVFSYLDLPSGYSYVVDYDGYNYNVQNGRWQFMFGVSNALYEMIDSGLYGKKSTDLISLGFNLVTSTYASPFVFSLPDGFYGQGSVDPSAIRFFSICLPSEIRGVYVADSSYYLSNSDGFDVEFSDKWLPYGLFTNRSSGNLGIVTNNFGNAQATQNTLLRASFSDLLFTCGDGFGYDSIRVTARPLWNGAKFINENGEVVTYSFSEQNEFIPLVINYIDYRRFDTQAWVRVADYSLFISSDGSTIAINPRLSWVSPLYMTPRFFRYPAGFVYPNWEISSDVGSTWAYWNRVNPPSGLTFFDWFSFSPEDVHISELDGFGGVFTLISSGFTSVMPLLNVQILPFLTLGMLLFAPVVVVLIVAIIKLLAK